MNDRKLRILFISFATTIWANCVAKDDPLIGVYSEPPSFDTRVLQVTLTSAFTYRIEENNFPGCYVPVTPPPPSLILEGKWQLKDGIVELTPNPEFPGERNPLPKFLVVENSNDVLTLIVPNGILKDPSRRILIREDLNGSFPDQPR